MQPTLQIFLFFFITWMWIRIIAPNEMKQYQNIQNVFSVKTRGMTPMNNSLTQNMTLANATLFGKITVYTDALML